jgi:glycosyltransferase involved in cell wall biosynthesis
MQTNVVSPLGKKKLSIAILINHFLPGEKSGGPARTVANILSVLGADYDFHIITRDRDIGDKDPYTDVAVDTWNNTYGAKVFYASPKMWRPKSIITTIRETNCDVVYVNGIYGMTASIAPLIAWKRGLLPGMGFVLAPRGSLAPSARKIKPARKAIFLAVARALGLFRGVLLQASSDFEASDIRQVIPTPNLQINVVADMLAPPEEPPIHVTRQIAGPLRICLVARVAPVKNIDFALEVLSHVKVPATFMVIGPLEDKHYLEACRALAATLPAHISVAFLGAVPSEELPIHLAQQDLMFLPTKGENFGHVIPEALSVGTPVLISDRTPWRNLAAAGIGYDLSLDEPAAFVGAIETFAGLSAEETARMRENARRFAKDARSNQSAVAATRQLFADALNRRQK